MTGQRLFLAKITFTAFLLMIFSCLTLDAECVMCLDIVPVCYYSSLRIVTIPFLYDLKGAFGSIQMKGQRLFLNGKMTGQTLFSKKKMTGQGLFSREKMKGQGLFSRRKNTVCPAHVPIIFAPFLPSFPYFITASIRVTRCHGSGLPIEIKAAIALPAYIFKPWLCFSDRF